MTFDEAYALTLTWEGGSRLHTVEGDPGGTTRFGLSQRAYPQIDMEKLTLLKASFYARRDYWTPMRCEYLDPAIRQYVFDMAFNMGLRTATRLLQSSVNVCRLAAGRNDPLKQDGEIGPLTLAGVDECRPERLLRVLKSARAAQYVTYGLANNGRHSKFIHGWLRRAEGGENG
jgi:lysozyme family protein